MKELKIQYDLDFDCFCIDGDVIYNIELFVKNASKAYKTVTIEYIRTLK